MNETFQVISTLIAALWWGGLVTIDLIATPARFRTPKVERDTILAVGQVVFRVFARTQVVYGILLLIVAGLGGAELAIFVLTGFMLLLAVVNAAVLDPAMVKLREDAGGFLEEGTPEKAQYTQFHRAYLASDIFKILLGGMLVAALVVG